MPEGYAGSKDVDIHALAGRTSAALPSFDASDPHADISETGGGPGIQQRTA